MSLNILLTITVDYQYSEKMGVSLAYVQYFSFLVSTLLLGYFAKKANDNKALLINVMHGLFDIFAIIVIAYFEVSSFLSLYGIS
jgi:hypothetical protein